MFSLKSYQSHCFLYIWGIFPCCWEGCDVIENNDINWDRNSRSLSFISNQELVIRPMILATTKEYIVNKWLLYSSQTSYTLKMILKRKEALRLVQSMNYNEMSRDLQPRRLILQEATWLQNHQESFQGLIPFWISNLLDSWRDQWEQDPLD